MTAIAILTILVGVGLLVLEIRARRRQRADIAEILQLVREKREWTQDLIARLGTSGEPVQGAQRQELTETMSLGEVLGPRRLTGDPWLDYVLSVFRESSRGAAVVGGEIDFACGAWQGPPQTADPWRLLRYEAEPSAHQYVH